QRAEAWPNLLLDNFDLSRGNCGSRPRTAKIEFWPTTHKGTERDVEESTLKHQQKRDREKLPLHNSMHNEVAEIDGKRQLRERERRFERPVFTASPRLRFAFNSVLWRPRKIRFVVNHRFEHCSRVVERETDS